MLAGIIDYSNEDEKIAFNFSGSFFLPPVFLSYISTSFALPVSLSMTTRFPLDSFFESSSSSMSPVDPLKVIVKFLSLMKGKIKGICKKVLLFFFFLCLDLWDFFLCTFLFHFLQSV